VLHVTYTARREMCTKVHLEDLGKDGRIILKLILNKWDLGKWNGFSSLRVGTSGGHL
jgi:hypothetical protein